MTKSILKKSENSQKDTPSHFGTHRVIVRDWC